jgi:sensor histidine kinase regulating citrate/malate metabolism
VVAHVPVVGQESPYARRVIGVAVVGRQYPTAVENLLSAVPNLLAYLGLSAAASIAGSLLLARRVKRSTLGLEPLEIRGMVEHREAMLTGIKEGVLALDPQHRVTLVNAEAHRMLRRPRDCVGKPGPSRRSTSAGARSTSSPFATRARTRSCSAAAEH